MTYCCTSSRQLSRFEKESKLWKEQFIIEKNCRKVLEDWILHTFGFDVKLEYEKDNNIARIQAIENKDEMKTATFPNESAEGEMKVVVMDIKMPAIEDIYEVEEGSLILSDVDSQSHQHQRLAIPMVPSETPQTQMVHISSGNPVSGYPVVPIVSHQQQYQHHQGSPIEIATTGDNSGVEQIVYIGNYEDGTMTGEQQSYYIIKSEGGDGEEIPVQFDYSNFINGDVGSHGDKQVYYRIATPAETAMQITATPAEPETFTPVPSITQRQAVKRKSPAPKTAGSKGSKAKKPAQLKTPKIKKYNIIIDPDPEKDNVASKNPTPKLNKNSPTKSSDDKNKSPIEFGLTLREKAEVYVRTKAKDAIRKVGSGYECGLCPNGNYSYSSEENAITHTKTHFEAKPYKCEACEETFGVQRELLHHRKISHPKPKGSEPKSPMKPAVMYSQQFTAQSPAKPVVVRTATIASPMANPVTPTSAVVAKSIKPIATPKDSKKQFKCQVGGCLWSYATAEELGWHMKAHSQARV